MNLGIFLIAISLSMDAFSLALSYGTLNIPKRTCIKISLIVGLFHFFMPILGSLIGYSFIKIVHADVSLLSGIIFLYIARGMFLEYKSNEEVDFDISLVGILIFALGVSLDAFGVGFTLNSKIITSALCFSICSFIFTLIGLKLGKIVNDYIGKIAILFGFSIMLLLAIVNFITFFG